MVFNYKHLKRLTEIYYSDTDLLTPYFSLTNRDDLFYSYHRATFTADTIS